MKLYNFDLCFKERYFKFFEFLFKVLSLSILFFVLLSFNLMCFADDENESDDFSSSSVQEVSISSSTPVLNSKRYVIYDRLSHRSVYGKDFDKQTAMASTTKIMTAIIVLENCSDLSEKIVVPNQAAIVQGSTLGLNKNDEITINDLLYGLLLRSGNDCAIALSIAIAENTESFISLMNKKAEALNLKSTHFVTPHGLDDSNHYTTASELAQITDYALNNKRFSEIVKSKTYVIHINGYAREISNTNEILCSNVEGVYGVKTGFTNNAGRCLVTSVKRGNLDFIVVVLACDTREYRAEDTMKLIDYAFKNFRYENLKTLINNEFENWKDINLNRIIINKASANLKVTLSDYNIKNIATKGEISLETNSLTYIEAPIYKNAKIGNIVVKCNDEILETIDILASSDVPKRTIKDYYKMLLKVYA